MSSLYREDLAYVHHAGFGAVPEAAARWLCAYAKEHRLPPGRVYDLGCGSGIFAAALRPLARSVHGVDVSKEMLRIARRTAPEARFRQGTLQDASLEDAAIVTMIGEGLNYLPALQPRSPRQAQPPLQPRSPRQAQPLLQPRSPRQAQPLLEPRSPRQARPVPLARLFGRVYAGLCEGGLFLFDLITGPLSKLVPVSGYRLGEDWAVLSETTATRHPQRFDRRIIVFRELEGAYRRSDETHRIQVYGRGEVLEALRAKGFRVRTLHSYAPEATLPGRTVFIARRGAGR